MQQVLFRLPIYTGWSPDGVPIYGFGVMLFIAFLVCTWLAGRRAEREGIPRETIQDLAIWIFLGGLIGARLVFLIGEQHLTDPVEILVQLPKIWDGGIVFYGSVIGGTLAYFLAYFLVYRHQGLETMRILDVVAPTVAVGLALGRFGCFLNGCCYGGVACATCLVTPVGFPLAAPAREALVHTGTQTLAGITVEEKSIVRKGDDKKLEHATIVFIDRVDETSAAYSAGLRPGMVLKEINGQEVKRPEDVGRLIHSVPRGHSTLKVTYIPSEGVKAETTTFRPRTIGLYPTQLYETISMVLLLLVLLAYDPLRRAPGQVMAVMMVGYGLHRYLNEILRDDPRPQGFEWMGSLVLIVAGLVLWAWLRLNPEEAPAGTSAGPGTPAPNPG